MDLLDTTPEKLAKYADFLAFPVYLVLAFAAAHRFPVGDTTFLFGITIVVLFFAAQLFGYFLQG